MHRGKIFIFETNFHIIFITGPYQIKVLYQILTPYHNEICKMHLFGSDAAKINTWN